MAAASPRPRDPPPPPVIGMAGPYTVFITPPSTPPPPPRPPASGESPLKSPSPSHSLTAAAPASPAPPLPPQFEKPVAGKGSDSGSVFGAFWNAVAKVQDAHSSLDECLAEWFGLDQSKYQWALNDYYENSGKKAEGKSGKSEQISGKGQSV